MKERQAKLFAVDFVFLEAPRWHQAKHCVSEVFNRIVRRFDPLQIAATTAAQNPEGRPRRSARS